MEMRTHNTGFRGRAGFLRTAAHLIGATFAALAMLTALGAGPALAASDTHAQPQSAMAGAPRVKYYIVPAPGHGATDLYRIAATTLHDPSRYLEIFRLNKGRLQPGGGRLENPRKIDKGWILRLPRDASGPGVRFGPLPRVRPSASARASHPPSGTSAGASPHSAFGWIGAGIAIVFAGMLVVFAAVGLTLALSQRRRSGGGTTLRRKSTRVKPPRPPGSKTGPAVPAGAKAAPGPPWPAAAADHPSWPHLSADHPSQPQPAADHPSWPLPAAGPANWPQPAADPPSWPQGGDTGAGGTGAGGPPVSDPPPPLPRRREPPQAQYWQPPPPPAPSPHQSAFYGMPGPVAASEAPLSPLPEPGGHFGQPNPRHGDLRHGDLRHAEPRHGDLRHAEPRHVEPRHGILRQAEPEHADSVRLVTRLLSDADQQAAQIREQASTQAAAIREAAEHEAAELREAVTTMSAELTRVATYVTQNLTIPLEPATRPEAKPSAAPAAKPSAAPAAKPASKPAARPATKPASRPATKPTAPPTARPGTRPRQFRAMRVTTAAFAALFLFAVVAGTTEIALHGFSFFVFRSAGTGSTPGNGLQENQGPGQPDAPGAHHHLHAPKP
ncbi:MAG TPA: hypothetical protein VMV17_09365 [Streptosporangiaceae bacterium]|nr:hypothetical protein [Streptosporangiaceae bacterium]